jgi:phosphoribosylformylglycinamidine synthase
MCIAGECGAWLSLEKVPSALFGVQLTEREMDATLLFSESNTRFLIEVPPQHADALEAIFAGKAPCRPIGKVTDDMQLQVRGLTGVPCLAADVAQLKQTWKQPLDW